MDFREANSMISGDESLFLLENYLLFIREVGAIIIIYHSRPEV